MCETCGHPWDEHDGMGDCCHPDLRTATGFCAGHERGNARSAVDRLAAIPVDPDATVIDYPEEGN